MGSLSPEAICKAQSGDIFEVIVILVIVAIAKIYETVKKSKKRLEQKQASQPQNSLKKQEQHQAQQTREAIRSKMKAQKAERHKYNPLEPDGQKLNSFQRHEKALERSQKARGEPTQTPRPQSEQAAKNPYTNIKDDLNRIQKLQNEAEQLRKKALRVQQRNQPKKQAHTKTQTFAGAQSNLIQSLENPNSAKQAIVLMEIMGPPNALKKEEGNNAFFYSLN